MSVLRQAQHLLELSTRGRGFTLLTPQVARWLAETQLSDGLLTLFIQHTSASLLNATRRSHWPLPRSIG